MIEDLVFRLRVDAGERVIQDQYSRIADEGPGDCGALFLPARERNAAFADHRFVALGEGFDIDGNVGCLCRSAHLRIGRRIYAQARCSREFDR